MKALQLVLAPGDLSTIFGGDSVDLHMTRHLDDNVIHTPAPFRFPQKSTARSYGRAGMSMLGWLLAGLCVSLGAPSTIIAQSLQDSGLELPGVWAGAASWGDYDDDGDLDLALIGEVLEDSLCVRSARIFRNDSGLLVEDVGQAERLSGVYYGDVGWADYDSDGDLDLGIVGWDSDNVESLALYRNEPGGTPGELLLTFDIAQTDDDGVSVFSGVRYAAMSWVDHDNDGDLDLVVSGMESNGISLTRVYANEDGSFQADELNSEALVNVHNGDLAWADYDSDGDVDLALSGETVFAEGEIQRVTEFYANDPVGSLNLDESVRVGSQVKGGALAWADYDTDGNPDLAVSGRDAFWISVLQLYKNRPAGVLSLDSNFNLNVFSTLDGTLDWIDYDNDGFLELAVSGRTILSDHVASVFANNEGTVTSASVEQNLEGLAGGLSLWGDYDGDGRADLLLSGVDVSGERRTILYGNLGTAEANRVPDPPEELQPVEVTSSRARFSWSPGGDVESTALSYEIRVGTEPGLGDIVSSASALGPGRAGFKTSFILNRFLAPDTYYWSIRSVDAALASSSFSQEGEFVVGRFVSSDQVLRSMDQSAMSWGDVDNDGYADLAIMGKNRSGEAQTLVYFNRDGVLTQDLTASLQPLRNGDLAWGDYDNDGDLDLMTTGEDSNGNKANILVRTDLSGTDEALFVSALRFQPDLASSSVDWGDVDNDGDLDLLLMGQSDDVEGGVQLSYTQLWINDGQSNFAPSTSTELVGLNNGEALFGDVDGDGDLDVMTTGVDSQDNLQALLYRNLLPDDDGMRDMGLAIPGMQSSDIALGDFDRDGDLDLVAGGLTATELATAIYTNDGVGGYEQLAGIELPGIQGGDLAWADFDNDQDLDLVLAGNTGGQTKTLQLYENTIGRTAPDAPFTLVDLPMLRSIDFSSVSMADVDGDGDLDLISAGKDDDASQSTAVNDNLAAQQLIVNRPPDAPSDLIAIDAADRVTLSWQAGSDDADPPVESLTYNTRVGTVPEGDDVLSGAIALGPGNTGARLTRELSGLTSGTYYWSVQTIDVGAARSEWREGDPFIIDTIEPTLSAFTLNKSQFGLGQTVTVGLSFLDEHAGVDAGVAPVVQAEIGGAAFPLSQLLFSGPTWGGELVVTADMPSGEAVLSVSGLVDLKGNSLADTSFSSFTVDTALPAIVDRLPIEGATEVPQSTSEITIGFSEAIDPATATAENFTVSRADTPVTLRVEQPADTSSTVTLIFEEALRPGWRYGVEVSAAIQDLAANRPADAISWNFSTEIPQLTGSVPATAATDVALDDGRLSATFDSGLDLSVLDGSVEILRNEQAVALRDAAVFDGETNTLSFEIAEGLLPGSRYQVVLSGLLAGPLGAVNQGDFDWRFTTAVPQITSLTPADGDTTVSVEDEMIRAVFDQRLDPEAVTAGNIRITRQGSPIETDEVEYNADSGSLSFSTEDGLDVGTRYAITIDGSMGGPLRQEIGDYTWSFSTAVPLVEITAPEGGQTVSIPDLTAATVQFSVPLDDDEVSPANFVLLREGSAVSLREGDPVVLGPGLYGLAEADGWKVGSSYAISVATSVQGPLGPGQVLGWQFQTAVPDTVSVSPASGAGDVDVNISAIVAVFDDLIDENALQVEGNVVLAREGRPIEITDPIGYDRTTGEVTIPVSDLRAGSSFQVIIDGDVAGPRASGEFRWGFRTRIPTLSSTTPPDGSSIAAGPRRIQLVFSSDVDEDLARDPANYRLTRAGQSIELVGSEFLYEAETFTVSLPEIEYVSGTGYELVVSSRLGGPRAQRPDDEFSFVTDLPTVVESSPSEASQGVTTSTAAIRLLFSGPLARQDADGFQLRARSVENVLGDASAPFGLLPITGFGLDATGSEVNFAPEGGFQPFTEYQVLVDPTVFGDLAIDGFTLGFTTAARIGDTSDGGTITNADRSVELYFPPNALSGGQSGEVLIQPLAAGEFGGGKVTAPKPTQAALTQIGQAWQIDGLGASLMKPATLTMRYTGGELDDRDATRLGIFRLDGADWVRIGGTADPATSQVRTTVESFATYALFEDLSTQVGALAIAGIDVQPQAFAPAGDRGNMRQETDISFDLSGPADVTVRVYSASGRLERVVTRDTPMGQGRNSLVWDGRDEDRKTVGSGLYIVVVSAGDEQAEKVVAVVR